MQLKDKKVLITGGSKGIGKAIAEQLVAAGAEVIITFKGDKQSADELVMSSNGRLTAIQADITKEVDVEKLFAGIDKLDILINNAGLFDNDDAPTSTQSFKNVFELNFLAQVQVTNAALEKMDFGKIIFMSSIHGRIGHGRPDAIAYSAMKAALDSYMKNLAKHLAPKILVNSVAPGKTWTPMWGEMDDETKQILVEDNLLKRWIEPEEVADGVIFLIKNDAIVGEILTVDAGMTLETLG